jgi:hypothetical protein
MELPQVDDHLPQAMARALGQEVPAEDPPGANRPPDVVLIE